MSLWVWGFMGFWVYGFLGLGFVGLGFRGSTRFSVLVYRFHDACYHGSSGLLLHLLWMGSRRL